MKFFIPIKIYVAATWVVSLCLDSVVSGQQKWHTSTQMTQTQLFLFILLD